jgi:hypothetical protein
VGDRTNDVAPIEIDHPALFLSKRGPAPWALPVPQMRMRRPAEWLPKYARKTDAACNPRRQDSFIGGHHLTG